VTDLESGIPVELDEVDTSPVPGLRYILVVDDTPANLVAAEAALAPLQRPVITACSGTDALARLLDHEFSLVLLDVYMPGMDGLETARWIRSRQRTQHLPIIFMTAHDHDQTPMLRAYELGAVDFLFKPVMPEVLRAKASVFVSLQERTEQLAAERLQREFENRRRDYETSMLRRERDREAASSKELVRLNHALSENDRRKDSFIAILAHELRNPLAPLRTAVDLIKDAPDQPLTPRLIEALERQTTTLSRLVEDLLDLSRIKADKIELRPEAMDLVELVEVAANTCRPLIDQRHHALLVEVPADPVAVIADSVRMSQVLCNLINNAARYTPVGGRIEVRCTSEGDEAIVQVIDNGVGIPAELQDSVFKMFVQERVRSDGTGGLGLGLALARRLVDMHHGSIRVKSGGRGLGSTFEVRLPLAASADALKPRKRTRDLEPLAKPPEPSAVRTIIIDDNEDVRDLMSQMLRARGFDVLTASDGPTALDMIKQHEPHVALLDLGLPGLDGYGVIEAVRAQIPSSRTRFVALTGYGEATDRERTARAGFDGHLVKPASVAAIIACIADAAAPRP
jgi:signal transduction histidine kinase